LTCNFPAELGIGLRLMSVVTKIRHKVSGRHLHLIIASDAANFFDNLSPIGLKPAAADQFGGSAASYQG
jgi:hypothetical protein